MNFWLNLPVSLIARDVLGFAALVLFCATLLVWGSLAGAT